MEKESIQSIFGPQMRVLLDLFHAVQRISTSMSKCHPFHKNCLQDLSLVFRDPNDQGQVRALETPAPAILLDNLGKFINKWTGVDYERQKVLTPKVVQQLTAIQKHMERGCLSHIQVGRGTNRNERLHRQLNSVLKSNRYGPEMANALITVTFFKHNEHLLAKAENRPPNPVSAYGLHSSQTQGENECFGLVTTSTTDTSLPQASSCTLRDVSYSQVLDILDTVRFTLQEDADLIESLQCLSDYDAFTILKKAISYQFITESALRQTGKQASSMLFNSFLHMVHSTEEHTTDDLALSNTLASWKFKRMPVASDGNCLFASVAMALIHHFQSGQLDANITLTRLGLLENDHGNPEAISRALRSAVVDEWLGDNADHYQGFCTGDIRAHAEEYRSSGEFAGDLGDLMVMTDANLIRVPLLLFTNVENMPTMVITPSLSVACTQFPLYLVFNAAGPSHYDYAVPAESAVPKKLCTTSKPLKCSCGRKSNFRVSPVQQIN